MNKKASVRDVLFIAVMIFGLGIGFFTVYKVINDSFDALTSQPIINSSNATVTALNAAKDLTARFDYVVFGAFIALTLGLIITGWFIGGIPIFMFIYFLIVVIGTIISTFFANIWETISQASVFGASVAAFPITNHLLTNLPYYVAVLGCIGILVMFAKPFFSGGEGY